MSWMNDFVRNLGSQNAPFGFAPSVQPSQGAVDPAYNAGWDMIGDAGLRMLASGSNKPLQAFGQAFGEAQDAARTRNKEQYSAKMLMDEAAENKRRREEAQAEVQKKNDWLKSISDPKTRAMLEANPELIDNYIAATDPAFQSAPELTADQRNFEYAQQNPEFGTFLQQGQGGGSSSWGMSVVPLKNKKTGALAAGQFNQGQGGIFMNGEPVDPEEWEYDPGALAQDRAEGTMVGGAPKTLIEDYTKTTRPAMVAISETAFSLREAKKFLEKGIQTGSMSENLQGLRGLGAQFGFNVDESILANTQAYQNFIGNTVIPRMAALGGNDSNEELRKLYSLSGGDINQSLAALKDTIGFMERLLKKKYKMLKSSEDVALKFIPPGLEPIPFGDEGGGAVVIDGYSIEED